MSGTFMRGALIQFIPTVLVPVPNVIAFQFNPETISHRLTPSQGAAAAQSGSTSAPRTDPLAASGVPGESFSFTLVMDSNDSIASKLPVSGSLAEASGLYTRIAALEMLLYPTGDFGDGLLGSVSAAAGVTAAAPASVPAAQLSTVLFVWGPMRIVPVRVSGLTITERLYDGLLRPTHAEAQIELTVLTPDELAVAKGPLAGVSKVAYGYTQALRQGFALANLANASESVVGMLPV